MDYLFSAFMGLVQGLSEFLPISSSGHLSIFQIVFGLDSNPLFSDTFFDVLLHFGTLISVFVAFWKDIRGMFTDFLALFSKSGRNNEAHRPGQRMILLILVATLPLLIVIPFQDAVEGLFTQLLFIGSALLVTSLLLFLSDAVTRGRRDEKSASIVDALIVGIMQAVAVCPGLSRSGSTIAAGIFCGFDRRFAVKFSFLMSIPAVVGAVGLKLIQAMNVGINVSLIPCYLLGMTVAGISGYFAIRLVRMIADKGKFGGFAIYCLIVGAITIVYYFFK